jgi:hypothetical protein
MSLQSGNGGPKGPVFKKPKNEPVEPEPPPVVEPPALTLCDLAQRALQRALETWAQVSGSKVSGYKVATRSATFITIDQASRAVRDAVEMVMKFCGPGALPPGVQDWAGAARRGIPTDA